MGAAGRPVPVAAVEGAVSGGGAALCSFAGPKIVRCSHYKKAGSDFTLPALAEEVGVEPSRRFPDLRDFESLEAGVFWSILSASLRLSERRKPLILLGFPAFSLLAQGFGDFSRQSRFSGKV